MFKFIRHYLALFFVMALVMTQALVFVVSKASQNYNQNYKLSAVFVEPLIGYSLASGQPVNIQAKLSTSDTNKFSTVYFTVVNSGTNFKANFEADLQTDGTWLASSAWQTTDLPEGWYDLSVTASIYNQDGSVANTFQSAPQFIYLTKTAVANNYQASVAADQILEEDSAVINKPQNDETVTADSLKTEASRTTPATNSSIIEVVAPKNSSETEIIKELPDVINQQILVNEPLAGTIITSNILSLDIKTNVPSQHVIVNLIKTDNPAIGTGAIEIAYVDGLSWVKNIELSESLVDGDYFLNVGALPSDVNNGATYPDVDVKLTLARGTKIIDILKPEDVVLLWHNVNQNLTKGDLLFASANVKDVSFMFEDPKINGISNILNTQEIDCTSLTDAKIKQEVVDNKNSYCFYALLGSEIITGNYHLYLTTAKPPVVKKDLGLVAIYNEEISEDTKELANNTTSTNTTSTEVIDLPEANELREFVNITPSCVEVGINTPQNCLIFKALESSLNKTCLQQEIYEGKACEDYLNTLKVDQECQTVSILDLEKCKDYLLEKYGGSVECRLADTQLCQDLLRNTFLNRLVVGSQEQDIIKEATDPLMGQVLSISKLGEELTNRGLINQILLLPTNSETKVLITKSQKETVLESAEKLTIINNAALVVDSDADGLVDDLEIYYDTGPLNPDSDADGYSDGMEVKNSYDPLGLGKLEKVGTILGEIIASESVLEQPKELSEKIDSQFVINQFLNKEDGAITLNGRAEANSWVILYLYSDLPLVMTTKTDASGNWSYDIKQSLTDGHHRVYVSLNDNTGQIVKQSSAFSLLVKKARAATPAEYFAEATTTNKVNNMLTYYTWGAGLLVVLALTIIIFLFYRSRHKKIEV